MNTEIKHSKYELLLAELEQEREQRNMYQRMYQEEKLRADLLQRDLDNVDDFNIFAEHETMSRLKRKPN